MGVRSLPPVFPSTIEVAGMHPIYFEPTQVESLLAAFDVALSEGRDSERVHAGFEQVRRFSWDRTARQTLDVYHTVLRSGGGEQENDLY